MSGIYGGDASENYGPFSYLLSFALSKFFFYNYIFVPKLDTNHPSN